MNNTDNYKTFSYGDVVEEKEDLDNAECPFCGEPMGQVMRDYTGYHSREILIHCDNPDCDNLYIRVYKFSHVIKLNKEEIKMQEIISPKVHNKILTSSETLSEYELKKNINNREQD